MRLEGSKSVLTRQKEQYVRELGVLKGLLTLVDFKVVTAKTTKSNKYKITNVNFIHRNKLGDLRAEPHSGVKADKVIFNFSNRIFIIDEKNVLELGLDFGLPGKKRKFIQHFLVYGKLANNLFHSDSTGRQNRLLGKLVHL